MLTRAIINLVKNPILEICETYSNANRANQVGDALEEYIKDLFSGAFHLSETERLKRYSEVFSYLGNTNNPPDAMIKGGDAIEIKKIQTEISIYRANAKDYNTAQDRKRVFYIGFRNDLGVSFHFPEGSTVEDKNKLTLRDVIWDLQYDAVPTIEKNVHNPKATNNNEYFTGSFSPIFMSRNRVRGWDEQAYTVQASGRQAQLHPQAPKMEKISKNKFQFKKDYESLYRRMSIREIARIQGFPDSFKFIYSQANNAYKMIGNAVPVQLSYEIAQELKKSMENL